MIAGWHVAADGRRGRVFTGPGAPLDEPALVELFRREVEPDDAARRQLLDRLLHEPVVHGTAHPGASAADVLHVYLEGRDGPLFACVVVSEARLETMLAEAPVVVEGLSLQVAPGRYLTSDAVRGALEAWAERNFGLPAPPRFDLRPWLDPDGWRDPGLAPAEPARCEEELPLEFDPGVPLGAEALGELGW